MSARHSRPGQGFTLIEVLVALLIMSVLAVLGWRGIDSMARSREVAQSASERSLRLSAIAAQFEADLLAVEDTKTAPGLAFDGAALRLTRRTDAGLQVVVWSLREGVWRRWASAGSTRVAGLQESWLASQQLLGNEPQQISLLDSVSGWQVYFYREGAWTNAQSTGELAATAASGTAGTPGTTTREKLPQGVRLVIELPEGKLTRDIALGPQLP
ncbi:prepilin-type N-terminal cleavage/methylation domain-containing protein [Aquabacterium sp.]|uniref:prepilin-type N-terminal cleavage/methylation domain-containing protein n=1 Tax=Aquabacterium sp. TaxID=1872578 RepID=UPI002BC43565|nr:prepilin-type N-terminal cleavage/methylation domain-containing protein [Aquabacterium sp.]HSW07117.1 prepilin-type N-terminal cleavage/methylation domain-containing protein [Aquabacterium sp.]